MTSVIKSSAAAIKAWKQRRGHAGQSQDSRDTAAVMLRSARTVVRGGAGRGVTRGGVRSAKSLLGLHARTVIKPTVALARLRLKVPGLVKKSMESYGFQDAKQEISDARSKKGEEFLSHHSARHYAARQRVRDVLTRSANDLREKLGYPAA